MTRNPVMNLWNAVVTAFLALCTSLGLITTTAAAVPATETARNTNTPQDATAQQEPIRARPRANSLPPTMKQRIHAEAHGSSPSCRHLPPTDAMDTDTAVAPGSAVAPDIADRAIANATAPVVAGTTNSAATAASATDSGGREAAKRDVIAALAHPSGSTHTTTGVIDTGTTTAGPAAGQVSELPTRATAIRRAPDAPAVQAVQAAPAMGAAPIAAVTLPSQSSAPVQLSVPAQLSAPVPPSAPVLTTAGTAPQR